MEESCLYCCVDCIACFVTSHKNIYRLLADPCTIAARALKYCFYYQPSPYNVVDRCIRYTLLLPPLVLPTLLISGGAYAPEAG